MAFTLENDTMSVPDEASFTSLFNSYYARLCFFAFGMVGHKENAEDIVQECFASLWQRRREINWSDDIGPYLYSMTRYGAYRHIRSRKPVEALREDCDAADEKNFLHQLIETETLHGIYQAIESLPAKCGDIFRALYVDGKRVKEISRDQHVTESTVRSHKAAALALLRCRPDLLVLGLCMLIC